MLPLSRSRTAVLVALGFLLTLLPAGGVASRLDAEITVDDAEIVVVRQADALLHFEDPVQPYPGFPVPPDDTTAAWDDLGVGDLNGDGDDEIAVVFTDTARLKVYDPVVQSGSDPMTLDTTYGTARVRVITADTDGDGERELALIRDFDAEDLCAVNITNQYTGELVDQLICTTIWHDLAAADLNGDGDHELVMVKRDTNEPDSTGKLKVWDVVVQPGETEITFQEDPSLYWWRDVAAGDVDADGEDEVILIRDYDKRLVVRKWNGTTLELIYEYYYEQPWKHATAGDIDGDGQDELVLVKADLVNYVHIDGSLGHTDPGPRPQADSWTAVATGDLNDDGDDEVVLLTSDSRIVVDDPVVQPGSDPVAFEKTYTAPWDLLGVGHFDGPVTYEPSPVLVDPSEVTIDAEVGEVNSATLSVTSPGDPVDWEAMLNSAPAWVSITPAQGTTPSEVTLTADCTGVAKDTYEMSITFDEAGGGGGVPLEVPVTIVVYAPTLAVFPTSMTLLHQAGAPDPAPRQISVTQREGDGQGIVWTAYVLPPTEGAALQALPEAEQVAALQGLEPQQIPWLDISPYFGTTPSTISADFLLGGLAGGAVEEAVILVDGGSGTNNRLQYVNVKVIVAVEAWRLHLPQVWQQP